MGCLCHRNPSCILAEELEKKVGPEVSSRLKERLVSHDPYSSENVVIGKTHRGTLVEINPYAAFADLVIAVGECMLSSLRRLRRGFKIVLPGVASYRSVAEHHFTWMRHRKSRVNILDGNPWYEEIVDAGQIARLSFKIDCIINEKKEIIKAFAGEPFAEHREASRYAASLYYAAFKSSRCNNYCGLPSRDWCPGDKGPHHGGVLHTSGGNDNLGGATKESGPLMPLVRHMSSSETASDFHRRLIRGENP